MNRFFTGILIVAATAMMAVPLAAADVNWVSLLTTDDMNDPANWSSNPSLPGAGDVMWVGNATVPTGTANLFSGYAGGSPDVLNVGVGAGFTGTINEDDMMTLTTGINVGSNGGTGIYNMTFGALTLQATNGTPWLMGVGSGSNATMTMNGFSSVNVSGFSPATNNDSAHIGADNGTASLTMNNNAVVTSTGNFYVGYTTGSTGTFTMNDDSFYQNTGGWTVIGGGSGVNGGTGHAFINGNASWNSLVTFVGHQGGTGTMDIDTNSSMTINGGLQIANSEIAGGGNQTPNTFGTVTLHNASNLTVNYLYVGAWDGGIGELDMSGTSQVTNTDSEELIRIGYLGSVGTVKMSGFANITSNNSITIGDSENWDNSVGTLEMSGNSSITQNAGNIHLGIWAGSTGTLTMKDNATITMAGYTLLVGDNWYDNGLPNHIGTGHLTMLDNSVISNPTGDVTVANLGLSQGDFTMGSSTTTDNPSVTCSVLWLGNGGTGDMTIWNGTFTAINGAELGSGGGGGTGVGHFTLNGGTFSVGGWVSVPDGQTGVVTINGGLFDHTGSGTNFWPLFIGRAGGTGTWNQNGGVTQDDGGTFLTEALWNGLQSHATLNLNGGVYATPYIRVWSGGDVATAGVATVNFNNGVLKAMSDSTSLGLISNTFNGQIHAYVQSGGAKIDTTDISSNAHIAVINIPLEHDPALGVTLDGGLEKMNNGSLTLTAANTYTGPTLVSGGTLVLGKTSSTATADVQVNAGKELDLSTPATNLGALTRLDLVSGSNLGLALTPLASGSNAINTSSGAMLNKNGLNFVVSAQGTSLQTGTPYTVIQGYSNAAVVGTLPTATVNIRGLTASATVGNTATTITISGAQASASLVWSGATPDTLPQVWNTVGASNWNANTAQFFELDTVKFDESLAVTTAAQQVVSVPGRVHPTAIFVNNSSNPFIFQGGGSITGDGTTLDKTGTGTVSFNVLGGLDCTGNINLHGGTLQTGLGMPASTTLPGAVNITNNAAVSVLGDKLTLSGVISDEGTSGLHKTDGGALAVGNANTYTGPTTIQGGSLNVSTITNAGAASSLGASDATSSNLVIGGGTLHYTGSAAQTTDRGFTLQATSAIMLDGDVTFSGIVDGSTGNDFYKQGPGKMKLTGATNNTSSFGKFMVVQAGTVELTGSGSYGNTDWFNVGVWGGTSGNWIQRGTTSYTHGGASGWSGFGIYSNGANVEMFDNSSFTSQAGEFDLGIQTTSTFKLHSNATFTVMGWGWMGGDGVGSNVTMELDDNSILHTDNWLNLGENNSTTNITLNTNAQLTAVDHFDFGWGDNTNNHTDAYGTSLIHSDNYINVGVEGVNAQGTVTMHDSSVLSTGTSISIGYDGGGGAIATVNLNNSAQMNIGTDIFQGHGHLVTGNLNLNDTSQTTVGGNMKLGQFGGSAIVNVNNSAQLTADGIQVGDNWGNDVTDFGVGLVNVNGSGAIVSVPGTGTHNNEGSGVILPNTIVIGAAGGIGTWNQFAGTTTSANPVIVGEYDYYPWDAGAQTPGSGQLNLIGGVFAAPAITTHSSASISPAALTVGVVNFNGGTLKALASNADFIAPDDPTAATLSLNVLNGGAKIDINGFALAINLPLNGAGTGGLEVMNSSGTPNSLKLTNAITYTGATLIDANATLVIENGMTTTLSTISGAGDLTVAGPSTVLNAASISVGTLTITSAAVAAAAAPAVNAVPEPSTLVLLALAGLGILLTAVRRRK